MGGYVELEIPAKPEYLGLARVIVAAAAGLDPSLGDERIDDLRIAVSEATTNAIEAHARLASDERVVVRCRLDEDRIEVEVVDHGPGFTPELVPPPPQPDDPERLGWERGLGLPLMKTLADEIDISSSDSGTTVKLVVYHTRAVSEGRAGRGS
ncbi:MAG: serine-protein kinase RsbW [Acidimicrobiales bacterium]|nr:MAG: serine-protein kinase RsbW [Acidimicrobiales bacterium]